MSYPRDTEEQGLPATSADLRNRAERNCISLATSYHAGRFLRLRSPTKKVRFPEDGTVHFPRSESLRNDREIRAADG